MKTPLILLFLLLPLLALAQPLEPYRHNFFTTNPAPVVDVVAGSNVFITPILIGTDTRRFRVDMPASGAATNIMVSAAGTNIVIVTNGFIYTISVDMGFTNQFATTNFANGVTNGFPWGVLYDPAGAATAATNGYVWTNLTVAMAGAVTNGYPWTNLTVAHASAVTNGYPWTNLIVAYAGAVTNGYPWTNIYSPGVSGGSTNQVYTQTGWSGNVGLSNITIGPLPTASADSKITIARNVDDTVAGNGHAFSDSSLINRSNTIAYNSFDARCAIIGTNNYDHYAGFQSLPTYGSSGNIGNYYGWYNGLGVTNGIVTNYYGIYLTTPNSTAPGAISNCYQLYMASPSGVYGNWGIFQADNGGVGNYLGYNTIIGPAHTLGIGFGTTNPSISSTLTINIGNASIGTNTPAPTQGLLVQGLSKLRGSTVIGSVNGTGFGGLEIGTNTMVGSSTLNMLLLSAQSEGLHSEKRIDFNLNNGTLYDQAYIGAAFDTGLTDGYLAFGNRSGSAVAQRMTLSGLGNLGLQGNLTVTNSLLASNLTAGATVTATNGYVHQLHATNGYTVCTQSKQFYLVNAYTNPLFVLPDASTVTGKEFVFSTTNNGCFFIVTNATGAQPIANGQYLSYTNQDNGIKVVRFVSDGAAWWLSSKGRITLPSASWSCNTNITFPNVTNMVTLDTQEANNGVGIALDNSAWFTPGVGSRIWVTNAGMYLLTFSAMWSKVGGGAANGDVWLRQDGAMLPRTMTLQTIQNATTTNVMTVNFILPVTKTTYFDLVGASPDGTAQMQAMPAITTPFARPAAPSMIVTIQKTSD